MSSTNFIALKGDRKYRLKSVVSELEEAITTLPAGESPG